MQLGDANLGDEGDEGKEPSSLEPRVGAVVGVERCNLGKQANLGDKGDEGKEPSSLGPRVWERRWVSRDAQVMQVLVTRVTKAEGHHRWSRVWERRWVSRDAPWG